MERPQDGPPPIRHGPPHETVVNGETFVVRQRTDEPGAYDFAWVSGPNENYGFGSQTSDGSERTSEELARSIVEFLDMIDPATGYIEDE
jgi:hypothetical protein